MKLEKVKTASEYLCYFQQEIFTSTLEDYPHLENYYQKLCEIFLAVSEEEIPLFEKLRKLLELDAKLQILLLYIQMDIVSEEQFSERELIYMIETDSLSFYREMIGLQKNSDINWSLVFLSEKNEKQ